MWKSNKVAGLLEKRQKIEKEIEELLNLCNHSMKSLKSVRERVDSSSPVIRWVCSDCSKILGYPNNFEMKNKKLYTKIGIPILYNSTYIWVSFYYKDGNQYLYLYISLIFIMFL